MDIKYLLLAKYAEFTPASTLNMIGGDNDKVEARSFPCVIPTVTAVVKLIMHPDECAVDHEVKGGIRFHDVGEVFAASEAHIIKAFPVPNPKPTTFLELGLVVQIHDVVISKPGLYEFLIAVDGEPKAMCHLRANFAGTMQSTYLAERSG